MEGKNYRHEDEFTTVSLIHDLGTPLHILQQARNA